MLDMPMGMAAWPRTIARSGQVVAKTNRQGIATLCREKCRDSRISAIRGQESRHSVGIAVALMVAGPYTLSRVRSQLGEGDATRRNVSSGVGPNHNVGGT